MTPKLPHKPDENGRHTDVLVKGSGPDKYLTTPTDGIASNNLNSL